MKQQRLRGGGLRHGRGSERKYIVRTARLVHEIERGSSAWKTLFTRAGLLTIANEEPKK